MDESKVEGESANISFREHLWIDVLWTSYIWKSFVHDRNLKISSVEYQMKDVVVAKSSG